MRGGGAIINLSRFIPQMPLPWLQLQQGLQERRQRAGEGGGETGRGATEKAWEAPVRRTHGGKALTFLLPCQPLFCTFFPLSSWGRQGEARGVRQAHLSPHIPEFRPLLQAAGGGGARGEFGAMVVW